SVAMVLALISVVSFAQSSFEVGLRLNPEFTALMNKNDADAGTELDYTSHFGYLSFGVGALYSINKNIGVDIDVLFSREGQAFTGNFDGSSLDSNAYSSVVAIQEFLNDTFLVGD